MMRLRTAIIAVVVFAVLFSALVLYIRSLASSFVPYVTPAAPGPVSLQAHVNTSRMITYNDTHNLADYALVSYSLRNATNAIVTLAAYTRNPMPRIYLLNVSAYCLSCFSSDYLSFDPPLGPGAVRDHKERNQLQLRQCHQRGQHTPELDRDSAIRRTARPLIGSSNASVFAMLNRGDTIIFAGRNFSSRSIDLNSLVYVDSASVISQFLSFGIAEAPFTNAVNKSFIPANMSFRGQTTVLVGGRQYGNATFINSANGTVITFTNYPTSGWNSAQDMANDISSAVNSRFWIPNPGRGGTSFAVGANGIGNVGAVAILSSVVNSTSIGRIANGTYSLVSVAARGPGGTAMEEFAFRNQYAWKGLVGVQSVAGERQNIPLTVLVNGNPNANTSVLLHLDMYDKNMSYVGTIPLAFVLVGARSCSTGRSPSPSRLLPDGAQGLQQQPLLRGALLSHERDLERHLAGLQERHLLVQRVHVDHQAAGHALGARLGVGGLARRGDGVHAAGRSRVVDQAEPVVWQSGPLPQPAEGHLFEFGGGRRCFPDHAVGIEGGGEQLAEDALGRRRIGEIGHEAGMVPERRGGHNQALEIGEDVRHRLAALGAAAPGWPPARAAARASPRSRSAPHPRPATSPASANPPSR